MKISIVIAEGQKQIMMTPETKHERQALKFITPTDTLEIASEWGTFDDKPTHYSKNVSLSMGGVFRRFAEEDSLMFVIREKKEAPKE